MTIPVVGNPEKTKILAGPALFVANQKQPTRNPRQAGFGAEDQICELVICLDGSATGVGAPATVSFSAESQVNELLDAHIKQITFSSSALGQIILTQSLSQLKRTASFAFGIYPEGIPALGDAKTLAVAGTWNYRIRLSIPFALPQYRSIGYMHAPFCSFMENGGIDITLGDGGFTDGAGVAWTIAGTTQVTSRLRTEVGRPKTRLSPLVYGYSTVNSLTKNEYPAGVYYSFAQLTDNASTIASNVAGAGHRIFVDGVMIQAYEEEDPATRLASVALGWTDRGAKLAAHFANIDAENSSPLNQPGSAIFAADVAGSASERLEVVETLVVDSGDLYSTASDFGYVYARPINEIGQGASCGDARPVSVAPRNPLGLSNSAGMPKGAMVAPEILRG